MPHGRGGKKFIFHVEINLIDFSSIGYDLYAVENVWSVLVRDVDTYFQLERLIWKNFLVCT